MRAVIAVAVTILAVRAGDTSGVGRRRPPANHPAGDRRSAVRSPSVLSSTSRVHRRTLGRSRHVADRRSSRATSATKIPITSSTSTGWTTSGRSRNVPRDWAAYLAEVRRRTRQPHGPSAVARRRDLQPARGAVPRRRQGDGTVRRRQRPISDGGARALRRGRARPPFHAVLNYDGQLTNQRGIHSRFETETVLRNARTLEAHAGQGPADRQHPGLHLRNAHLRRNPGRDDPRRRPQGHHRARVLRRRLLQRRSRTACGRSSNGGSARPRAASSASS